MLFQAKVLLRIALGTLLLTASCAPASEEAPKGKDSGKQKSRDNDDQSDDSRPNVKNKKSEDSGKEDRLGDENEDSKKEDSGELPERKRIEFVGSKGDTVPGYLWLPAKSAGKAPALFMMYGISDDKDSGSIGAAAKEMQKKGYVSLTIDWPGTGERGSISKQSRIMDSSVKDWTVADYVKAVDFLASRPEVDTSRIGYVGASMGAMTGLAFASRDPRIKALVAIVPIPNPLWGGDDPQSSIRAIAPRPVMCISTQDNSDMSGMVCSNNSGENHVLGGGHELSGMRGKVVELAEAFFVKHLD